MIQSKKIGAERLLLSSAPRSLDSPVPCNQLGNMAFEEKPQTRDSFVNTHWLAVSTCFKPFQPKPSQWSNGPGQIGRVSRLPSFFWLFDEGFMPHTCVGQLLIWKSPKESHPAWDFQHQLQTWRNRLRAWLQVPAFWAPATSRWELSLCHPAVSPTSMQKPRENHGKSVHARILLLVCLL